MSALKFPTPAALLEMAQPFIKKVDVLDEEVEVLKRLMGALDGRVDALALAIGILEEDTATLRMELRDHQYWHKDGGQSPIIRDLAVERDEGQEHSDGA